VEESRRTPPVLTLGIPVAYIPHAKPARILAELGLDGAGVAASVKKVLAAAESPHPVLDLASTPLDLD
jgi:deoxyxylulose-5-phosphate synthase